MKITIKKIFWYLLCFLPFADSLNGYLNGGGNEGDYPLVLSIE